jgi:hypothetical protein
VLRATGILDENYELIISSLQHWIEEDDQESSAWFQLIRNDQICRFNDADGQFIQFHDLENICRQFVSENMKSGGLYPLKTISFHSFTSRVFQLPSSVPSSIFPTLLNLLHLPLLSYEAKLVRRLFKSFVFRHPSVDELMASSRRESIDSNLHLGRMLTGKYSIPCIFHILTLFCSLSEY